MENLPLNLESNASATYKYFVYNKLFGIDI